MCALRQRDPTGQPGPSYLSAMECRGAAIAGGLGSTVRGGGEGLPVRRRDVTPGSPGSCLVPFSVPVGEAGHGGRRRTFGGAALP